MAKPSVPCPSFLAFVTDNDSHSVLQRFAIAQGWEADCVHKGTAEDATAFLSNNPSPEFLLVDLPVAEDAPDALDQLADVCDPDVKVIVTSTVDEFSFFRWLKEIGVYHYLLKPLSESALEDALLKPVGSTAETESKTEKLGKLIAVIGTRGGVGSTTVALNLSNVLASRHEVDTAILDLEPQWGTVSLMLDLEPGRGLREALAKPDRIDALFMERVMLRYHPKLAVLSSEEPFDETIAASDGAAEALLNQTRQKFEMVVADLPRELSPFTEAVLAQADHVIVVTELSVASLRDAMRLDDYLREHLKLRRVHVVANRQGMLPKFEMPVKDFAKNLSHPMRHVIPFDLAAFGLMATGELPTQKTPASPMSKAIAELAETFHNSKTSGAQGSDSKPKWANWLKKGK